MALCGSCQAVLPKSAKSDFFVLTALEPPLQATPPAAAPSLLLGRVVLPGYLERRELVTRLGSNQLRVEDFELWAEPLRDSVARTVEQDLTTLLGRGTVQRLPWTATTRPDGIISVEIRRFEKTSRQTVDLVASWTISDSGGGVRLSRQTRLSRPFAAPTTEAAVVGMSDALATLSREIAAGVQGLARQGSVTTKDSLAAQKAH